jgi:hypothetical protein
MTTTARPGRRRRADPLRKKDAAIGPQLLPGTGRQHHPITC